MSLRHMCDGCGKFETKRHLLSAIPPGWINVKIVNSLSAGVLNGEYHSIQCLIDSLTKIEASRKRREKVKEPT